MTFRLVKLSCILSIAFSPPKYLLAMSNIPREDRRPLTLLEELGEKHKPSKRIEGYLPRYSFFLDSRRDSISNVIEVGVYFGNSLRMWSEYFPNAVIHGLDIDPAAKKHEEERIKITIGDSRDPEAIRRLAQSIQGDIDLIVDDGSHHPFDQVATFKALFPRLASGGLYFIEDVGGTRGPLRQRATHAFMELVEGVNYWPKTFSAEQVHSFGEFDTDNRWIRTVVGVSFYRYLVVVEKGNNPMDNPYLTGTATSSPVPPVSGRRLRELPWPRYRRRRHFVSKREARPERLYRLALRYLLRRW